MSGESPILETEHADAAQAMASKSQAEKSAKRDACTCVTWSPFFHKKTSEPPPSKTNIKNRIGARDGLGAYIEKPESYPSSVVVYYNDDFVVIHDMFPKSTLHLLLLPRDPTKTRLHPFEAFEDPEFLSKVKAETRKLRTLAAAELRRKYGRYSAQDKERQDALNADLPPDVLPQGRDWEKEVMCGIHAHPSMNHLHIHIISVDRYSDRLKHRKHYNSFSTPFFVDIEDFPLTKDDARRHPDREGYLRRDFKCWRCGKDFSNKFAELKSHLEAEFDEWKRL
ncbi:DNA 5'-adenosine monophosphate hydrolase [Aspergillus novofumigatus IBT 16806]|uniref:Aprataxin-like protein n=1 Tax=Aspergillus novofumigatus (strain IBT 16806) TaxID=1392255 RepID=A0A2I1CPA3_ASPN1|nr:HIT-like protein [Aspergillus novofumigatus IBT 16806]PKX99442.1 HIT-like protein [Aspergillus novofumigatus IBT 16806]